MIHPTAVVHPSARVDGVEIGPYCVVGENVEIGAGTVLVAHVCIGTPPQHRTCRDLMGVRIGRGCVFHEFAQAHHGTRHATTVGDNCYIMSGASVQHDCVLENDVTMCSNVTLGGHVWIGRGANLGQLATVHQFQRIGAYSMLGMGAVVPKSARIEPGQIYAGNPARWLRQNDIGLERAKVTDLAPHIQRWRDAA
jgi:UDP-N-acetylglucosamine acyltransferase